MSRTTLDSLPDSFKDFWDSDPLSKRLLDGSMLRAAEWCEINGFDPWWQRLERRRQAVVSEQGAAQPLWWLFNMARSELAVRTMPLLKRCLSEFTPAVECEPLPAFTSTIIFTHHRLRLPSSPVIDRLVDVLLGGRDLVGGWRNWAGDPELSIEATAMALHALALAQPTTWKSVAEKGQEWLWSKQAGDGAWYEDENPTYLTVLVLDAINLADENPVTTLKCAAAAEPPNGTVSKAVTPTAPNVAARRARGPRVPIDKYRELERIVAGHGPNWQASEAALAAICKWMDEADLPKSKGWARWERPRPKTWEEALECRPRPVVQAIEHRIRQTSKRS